MEERTSRRSAWRSPKKESREPETPPAQRQRAKSSSRIISMFENLERSIINQFGYSSSRSRNKSSTTSKSANASKKFNPLQAINPNQNNTTRHQQPKNSNSCPEKNKGQPADCGAPRGEQVQGRTAAAAGNPQAPSRQQVTTGGGVNNGTRASPTKATNPSLQQQQPDNQQTAGFCQTTLGKCQQRLVSTMRAAGQQPHPTAHNPAKSNKLYIPPPHANEQLRNQNQLLIFGETGLPPANNGGTGNNATDSKQPPSSLLPDSSGGAGRGCAAPSQPASSGRRSAIGLKIDDAIGGQQLQNHNSARTIARINRNSSANQQSSSTASPQQQQPPPPVAATANAVEKSFSTLHRNATYRDSWPEQLAGAQSGSRQSSSNNNNTDPNTDDDSGFSSYKSRFPFPANSNTQPSHHQPEPAEESSNASTKSNMISVYGSNFQHGLPPNAPATAYNQHQPSRMLPSNQHLLYRYPINHQQQQHNALGLASQQNQHFSFATSHQLSMPDLSARVVNHNHNHLYPEHSFTNVPHHSLSMYNPLLIQHPDRSFQDNSHEIYANAPPKPKRYQYYNQNLLHNQQQQIVNSQLQGGPYTPSMTLAGGQQPYTTNAFQYNNNQIASRQPLNPGHPLLNYPYSNNSNTNQPAPISQQQQQHHPTSAPFNSHPYMNVAARSYVNHISVQPPHPLIRSKSSLAAEDFIYRAKHQQQQQQHPSLFNYLEPNQYPVYETNFQRSNRYSANINLTNYQQQTQQFVSHQRANLQRSKSVTHLASDYDMPLMAPDSQAQTFRNILNPKFLSHSTSSTNLNLLPALPPPPGQHQQAPLQLSANHRQHSINPLPGHPTSGAQQQQQQQLGESQLPAGMFDQNQRGGGRQSGMVVSMSQQGKQSPSAQSGYSARNQQHFMTNSQWGVNNSATGGQSVRVNHQPQDLHRIALANKQHHHHQTLPRDKSIGSAAASCAAGEGRSSEPSLDDKIRCLMIGNEQQGGNSIMVKQQADDNSPATNQPRKCYVNNGAASGGCSSASPSSLHLENSAAPFNVSKQSAQVAPAGWERQFDSHKTPITGADHANHQQQQQQSLAIYQNSANLIDSFAFPSRSENPYPEEQSIYMNDFKFSSMGNRHQSQYRPHQQFASQQQSELAEESYHKASPNSHLIVDLTTPRVLAKTQTTLSACSTATSGLHSSKHRTSSCSINQLGLPRLSRSISSIASLSSSSGNNLSGSRDEPEVAERAPHSAGGGGGGEEEGTGAPGDLQTAVANNNPQDTTVATTTPTTTATTTTTNERTAPYYYSDLKSEEQRKAFLSMMQQKSLSPPPQLLSRSADQSSTRLGPTMSLKQAPIESVQSNNNNNNNNHHTTTTNNNNNNNEESAKESGAGKKDAEKEEEEEEESRGADSLELIREDDDFIEFQSMDGVAAGHGSQFEASQFSASDLNTSSASNSSSSSSSAADSLNSPRALNNGPATTIENSNNNNSNSNNNPLPVTATSATKSSAPASSRSGARPAPSTGILKKSAGSNYLSDTTKGNEEHNEDCDDDDRHHHQHHEEKGGYTNVLGNVVDVVEAGSSPVDKLSARHRRASPVTNQAVC